MAGKANRAGELQNEQLILLPKHCLPRAFEMVVLAPTEAQLAVCAKHREQRKFLAHNRRGLSKYWAPRLEFAQAVALGESMLVPEHDVFRPLRSDEGLPGTRQAK